MCALAVKVGWLAEHRSWETDFPFLIRQLLREHHSLPFSKWRISLRVLLIALVGQCSNCLLDEQSVSSGSPQGGRPQSMCVRFKTSR